MKTATVFRKDEKGEWAQYARGIVVGETSSHYQIQSMPNSGEHFNELFAKQSKLVKTVVDGE